MDELEKKVELLEEVIKILAQELYGNEGNDITNEWENIPHETGFIM